MADERYFPVHRVIFEAISYEANETRFHQAWLTNIKPFGKLSDPYTPHSDTNPWLPQIVRAQRESQVRAGNGNIVRAGRADNPTVYGSYVAQHAAALAGYRVAADYDSQVNTDYPTLGPAWDWDRRLSALYELAKAEIQRP